MTNSELFVRQSKFYSPEKMNRHVTVIGCGSLGGFITIALVKMGLTDFTLYDDDVIAPHNIANQPFLNCDIEREKVSALANMMKFFSPNHSNNMNITPISDKWEQKSGIRKGVVINAPDSITVRREVFNQTPPGSLIIDVRSGPESYDVFFCDTGNPKMTAFYAGTFFDESNAVGNGCGAQSVVWCGMQVAALAANGLMRHCNKKHLPVHVSGSLETLHTDQLYPNGEVDWTPEEPEPAVQSGQL